MQYRILITALVIAVLLAAPAAAGRDGGQGASAADQQFSGTLMTVSPKGAYGSAELRITGPQGYALTKRFSGGAISVDLLVDAEQGVARLADGRYRFEVVLDRGAGMRVSSGSFYVQNGAAISRAEMARQLGAVQGDLNQADAERRAAPAPTSPLEGPSQEDLLDNNAFVNDTSEDGITYLELESFNNPPDDADWELENRHGDLRFDQEGGTAGSGTRMTVLDGGAVGFGTTAPQDIMHAVSGKNDSFVRIENTFSGETWRFGVDSGGDYIINLNATNGTGSTGNKLEISDLTGNVGLKTSAPTADLHIFQTDSAVNDRVFVKLQGSTFAPQFEYIDGSGGTWREGMNNAGDFVINQTDDLGVAELLIKPDGRVLVNGSQVHPDYVFDEGYDLMELSELARFIQQNGHLPGVVSGTDAAGTVDLSSLPLQLLEKIEELALYTIEQDEKLSAKDARIQALEARLAAIEERLAGQQQ